jgi:metal-dependent amidase/aminoacylase/carboxypeptidase family protein
MIREQTVNRTLWKFIPRSKYILVFALMVGFACNTKPDQLALEKRISDRATGIYDDLVQIRRDFHEHPELSGLESRTAGVVAERLESYGLEVRTHVGGHGVVGILRGSKEEPVVAYRSDMDAIPQDILEDVPYKSANPGVSHACGHDVHTTIGLGIAEVLSTMKDDLPGTVVFFFQPAEETGEGAKQMMAEGILEDFDPDAIFAVHVAPIERGIIVTNPGVGLPGIEQFTIRLRGEENLEVTALALVDSIRAIGTVHYPDTVEEWGVYSNAWFEKNSTLSSFVLAMAWVNEQDSEDERVIHGFFKASGDKEYIEAEAEVQRLSSMYISRGFSVETEFEKVLPDMFCDKELAEWAIDPLKNILGEQSVLYANNSFPFFGEDFAYFIERIPGVMFFLGASNRENGISALPHSPAFAVDEEAILVGVKGMSMVISQYLLDYPVRKGTGLTSYTFRR